MQKATPFQDQQGFVYKNGKLVPPNEKESLQKFKQICVTKRDDLSIPRLFTYAGIKDWKATPEEKFTFATTKLPALMVKKELNISDKDYEEQKAAYSKNNSKKKNAKPFEEYFFTSKLKNLYEEFKQEKQTLKALFNIVSPDEYVKELLATDLKLTDEGCLPEEELEKMLKTMSVKEALYLCLIQTEVFTDEQLSNSAFSITKEHLDLFAKNISSYCFEGIACPKNNLLIDDILANSKDHYTILCEYVLHSANENISFVDAIKQKITYLKWLNKIFSFYIDYCDKLYIKIADFEDVASVSIDNLYCAPSSELGSVFIEILKVYKYQLLSNILKEDYSEEEFKYVFDKNHLKEYNTNEELQTDEPKQQTDFNLNKTNAQETTSHQDPQEGGLNLADFSKMSFKSTLGSSSQKYSQLKQRLLDLKSKKKEQDSTFIKTPKILHHVTQFKSVGIIHCIPDEFCNAAFKGFGSIDVSDVSDVSKKTVIYGELKTGLTRQPAMQFMVCDKNANGFKKFLTIPTTEESVNVSDVKTNDKTDQEFVSKSLELASKFSESILGKKYTGVNDCLRQNKTLLQNIIKYPEKLEQKSMSQSK